MWRPNSEFSQNVSRTTNFFKVSKWDRNLLQRNRKTQKPSTVHLPKKSPNVSLQSRKHPPSAVGRKASRDPRTEPLSLGVGGEGPEPALERREASRGRTCCRPCTWPGGADGRPGEVGGTVLVWGRVRKACCSGKSGPKGDA